MFKTLKIIILILICGVVIFLVSTRLLTEEDTWLCQNGQWVKHGAPSEPMPNTPCEGAEIKITNFEECATVYPVMESYPRRCAVPGGQTFSEEIGNELDKTDLIKISSPRPNEKIKSPLVITGEARGSWFFEASFPVKLYDEKNNLLASGVATANPPAGGDWMTENFVPFKAELNFSVAEAQKGVLVLEKDNPSGLPENADSLKVPVYLEIGAAVLEKTKVKVYFQNAEVDVATDYDCNKAIAVEREVIKTEAVARVAIEELLKGPSANETQIGFTSNINSGVKLQNIIIENGVAKADFSADLEQGVGGSCAVAAIRAQITETLKQFSTVKEVVISINGRVEDILQP